VKGLFHTFPPLRDKPQGSGTAQKMMFLLKFILGLSAMFGNFNFVLFITFGPAGHLFILEIFSGMEIIKIVVRASNFS
jgi:hypothetical protein